MTTDTASPLVARPTEGDFAPYYGGYVSQVPPGDLRAILRAAMRDTGALVRALPEERLRHRYAPDKWSIAEVLLHVADTERIFAYRLLRIARGDETPLPGFDQESYVTTSGAGRRTRDSLADELERVRGATLSLVDALDASALARRGTASGFPVTALAMACIIAGHEAHHVRILRERYL